MNDMGITVVKRDGREVDFVVDKIKWAILGAVHRSTDECSPTQAEKLSYNVAVRVTDGMSVEDIQDLVEEVLMQHEMYDTARSYIKYRQKRTEEREKATNLMEFVSDVIDLKNVENENANMPEWVFTAKNVKMSAEVAKRYAMDYLLSTDVKKAFKANEIYIHDFSHYAVGSHNCLTLDLADILARGFKASNGDVRPPTTIRSAMQLTAVTLQCVSNCQFGKC